MDRRKFITAMGTAAAWPHALAQKPAALPVVGVLTPQPPGPPDAPISKAIRERYRQAGWIVGENLIIDRPNAEGREDRLPEMAEALARKRVSVIWALGPEAAVAAARATKSIPIVFWGVTWPVEQGLVDSFARPGRNVTGVAFGVGTEWQKRLESLRELVPKASRVAAIVTPSASQTVGGDVYRPPEARDQELMRQMGFELERFEIARAEDIDGALAAALAWRPHALGVPGTTLTFRERKRFAEFALQRKLPSVFNQKEFVEAGGLFSYGIDTPATIVHTIGFVNRILSGAKPADLPVELPNRYEFVINLKTAAALGIKVPQVALLRADRVIE